MAGGDFGRATVWDFWGTSGHEEIFGGASGSTFDVFGGKNLVWWNDVFGGVFEILV
jgi:hypothetical protein